MIILRLRSDSAGQRTWMLGRSSEFQVSAGVNWQCGKCGARRIDSQIGLEPSFTDYIETMTAVFARSAACCARMARCG